jgi:hypothetical protein
MMERLAGRVPADMARRARLGTDAFFGPDAEAGVDAPRLRWPELSGGEPRKDERRRERDPAAEKEVEDVAPLGARLSRQPPALLAVLREAFALDPARRATPEQALAAAYFAPGPGGADGPAGDGA